MNLVVFNQPARAVMAVGLRQLLAMVCIGFVLISIGCNADPRCRRETALMRAEILDIEDKYVALQSKYELTALRLHEFTGEPIDQTLYGATSNYHDVILSEEIISNGAAYPTQVGPTHTAPIYVDQTHIESYPPENVIYDSTPTHSYSTAPGVIPESPSTHLNAPQGVLTAPIQEPGLPATGNSRIESFNQDIPEPVPAPQPQPHLDPLQENLQGLPLPNNTRNQLRNNTDDFELELSSRGRRSIPAIQASTKRRINRSEIRNTATHRSTATEIAVNRSVTGGQDVNDSPGDEGLNLLLQTKDASGQIVLQAGELTVSLIDPKQRQRIGFWRFLPGETELFFVDEQKDTDGILLHLPWDESAPQRARLLVHAQFVTADGRILTTSSDVLIEPPTEEYSPEDPTVINWTQRDARWGDTGAYVSTNVSSDREDSGYGDSFSGNRRPRTKEAWQPNGTYNRGAKFSQPNDRDYPNKRPSDPAWKTEVTDHPDQPKWRPVR